MSKDSESFFSFPSSWIYLECATCCWSKYLMHIFTRQFAKNLLVNRLNKGATLCLMSPWPTNIFFFFTKASGATCSSWSCDECLAGQRGTDKHGCSARVINMHWGWWLLDSSPFNWRWESLHHCGAFSPHFSTLWRSMSFFDVSTASQSARFLLKWPGLLTPMRVSGSMRWLVWHMTKQTKKKKQQQSWTML